MSFRESLEKAIGLLESDDMDRQRRGLSLLGGTQFLEPDDDVSIVRAEVLKFLMDLATTRSGRIDTLGRIAFSVQHNELTIDGAPRDRIVSYLALHHDRETVGRIRVCGARGLVGRLPPAGKSKFGRCGRLFVKNYRQEFCSTRCRDREAARRKHEADDRWKGSRGGEARKK
jgi:hypothetical protein